MKTAAGVRVRAATPADLSTIVELRLALIREHADNRLYSRLRDDAGERARRLFAQQLASANEQMFLAEEQGRTVGIIRCVESVGSPLLEPSRYAYVSSAFVRPDARRRGTLRMLVDAARAWCAERGLTEMRLHSVAGDEGSNAAWEALGFTVVELMRVSSVNHETGDMRHHET